MPARKPNGSPEASDPTSARRVFFLRPTLGTGGADSVTLTLLRHLDRRLFQPSLVLLRKGGQRLPDVPNDIRVFDLAARNLLTGAAPLRRLLSQEKPDILMSTSSGTNITAALAAGGNGPRLVLSERNGLVRDQPLYKLAPLLFLKRVLYGRADCVTAVSRGVARDLERRLRLEEDSVVVVHNPIVSPALDPEADSDPGEPWFREKETPVILAAGRLVHAKGFDVLLDAIAQTRTTLDCRLILLGDGPLRASLEKQIHRLGLSDSVKMPGFVNNPAAYMRRSSVFVLSSRFEGLPGVLIQAMACGTPVIATDCPYGPAEIIEHGSNGMLTEDENASALSTTLSNLLCDPGKRRQLSDLAVRSSQRFTLEAVLPNYVRALAPDIP